MWRPFGETISTSFLSLSWNGGLEGVSQTSHCPCLDLMVSRGRDQTCAAVLMFRSLLIVLGSVSKLLSSSLFAVILLIKLSSIVSVSRYKVIQDRVPTTLLRRSVL